MAHSYFLQIDGKSTGPCSAAQLKELAVQGKLKSSDLIRREDMTEWQPASKFKGLFPESAPSISTDHTTKSPSSSGNPDQAPGGSASTTPAANQPEVLHTTSRMNARQMLNEQVDKLRPVAERYAKELEMDTRAFVAAAFGGVCLILLMLSTFLAWEFNSIQAGEVLKGIGNTTYNAGLDSPKANGYVSLRLWESPHWCAPSLSNVYSR